MNRADELYGVDSGTTTVTDAEAAVRRRATSSVRTDGGRQTQRYILGLEARGRLRLSVRHVLHQYVYWTMSSSITEWHQRRVDHGSEPASGAVVICATRRSPRQQITLTSTLRRNVRALTVPSKHACRVFAHRRVY